MSGVLAAGAFARRVHLSQPCQPARPESCPFCAEAAANSRRLPTWMERQRAGLNPAKELAR